MNKVILAIVMTIVAVSLQSAVLKRCSHIQETHSMGNK